MRARTLSRHLGWTSPILVVSFAACVATPSPRIRACAASGGSPASEGTLRILPSTVSGVEIDSAYWRTGAGTEDIGAWEQLSYYSRLHASRAVRRNELAVVYVPHDSAMIIDADVASMLPGRELIDNPDRAYVDLHAQDTTTTARHIRIGSGFRVGKWSAASYCPRAVQLVARNEVPFLLMPRLTSDSARSAAARSGAARRSPLVVVKDTLLAAGSFGSSVLALAAINVADTALADMIVALVVVRPVQSRDSSAHDVGQAVEDTIEFHVGPVAARGRVGLVGGELRYPEGIAERLAYPAASVTGRAIPRLGEMGRVSDARSVARERTWDSTFDRARASDALWTDSLSYVARQMREVTPGFYELTPGVYDLRIVARWRNPMPTALYLPRCVARGGPAYKIVRPTRPRVPTAYSPKAPCPSGLRALRIGPDSARVDTLHLRTVYSAVEDPDQLEKLKVEGPFRLVVDVLLCDDDGLTCRPAGVPEQFDRSRPFRVRLGSM